MRKYAPHQVIESITESDMSNLFPNTERIAKFYENHLKTLSPTQEETMKIKNRFGKDEFQNMIEWIGLLGPSIVSKIYSYDSRELFIKQTKEWQDRWDEMFGDESNNDSLSNNYRLTELKSMTKQLGSLDAEDQIQMAKFLFDLNIVDSSHLAAIPSALVYDYAPLILKDIIEPTITVSYMGPDGNEVGSATLDEHSINQFILPNQPPALEVAKSVSYKLWQDDVKGELLKSNVKLPLQFVCKPQSGHNSYLRISSSNEGRQKNNVYDITPSFMKDFATIKHAQLLKYPEFGSTTFLNKLVIASADVNSQTIKRDISEKPKFRNAHEDIRINSLPRHLHSDETDSSILLRTMLLGNPAEPGTRAFSLLKANLRKYCEEEWLKSVQNAKSQDYGDAFDPNQFDICLKDRLKTFSENSTLPRRPLPMTQFLN